MRLHKQISHNTAENTHDIAVWWILF